MTYIAYAFGLTYALWVFYLAVMNLKRARDDGKLTVVAKFFGYPVLFIGLAMDFLVNVLICSVVFLEIPKETLVTARLIRHKKSNGWRSKVASWICTHLLDQFDPSGCHCK